MTLEQFTGVHMDGNSYNNASMANAGLPYDNINWYDIDGQPFGPASKFNLLVLNDANNIVDVEGPVAVGVSFNSLRGFSDGFARDKSSRDANYSPDLVRFLVGGNVAMSEPLVVVGHVVAGGGFRAGKGSTYLIGKSDKADQIETLKALYQANGGSQYWTPSDKGNHYLISSYDVPRYIPAGRINADVSKFFSDAKESIGNYKNCIENLNTNGSVVDFFISLFLSLSGINCNVSLIIFWSCEVVVISSPFFIARVTARAISSA